MKKTAAAIAAVIAAGTVTASAMEVPEIYTQAGAADIIQQTGICDISKKLTGSTESVTGFYSGVISAGFADITGDEQPEMITVESDKISIYSIGQDGGIKKLWTYLTDLIANEGESYANVFLKTLPTELGDGSLIYDDHICIETYSNNSSGRSYKLVVLEPISADDELRLTEKTVISRTKTENTESQFVNAKNGIVAYSYTMDAGDSSSYGNYPDLITAARDTLFGYGFAEDYFLTCQNRLWFDEPDIPNTDNINDTLIAKIKQLKKDKNYKAAEMVECQPLTYIYAKNVNQNSPSVTIENYSPIDKIMDSAPIRVVVNGQRLDFDQNPVMQEGRTLVPVRGIFESLGAEVAWIGNGGWVVAGTPDTIINMQVDSDTYIVNGTVKKLDVPAQLINDRTMVPVRAISESLGAKVDWNQGTKTINITK